MRKISVCGIGNHALKNLLPAIDRSKNVELVGIWTRNDETRFNITQKYQVTNYDSLEDLLADSRADTVVVSSPTGLHHYFGKRVLESGKNLWCEKSLVCNLNELDELEILASDNSLEIREMFMFLHHKQYDTISRIIDSGRIGKIISVSSCFGFPHLNSDNIRYNPKIGGGALFDAGCYPIALSHSLIGPNPVEIWSKIISDSEHEVDTSGTAILSYEEGIVAILEWGFGQYYRNEVEIIGEVGKIRSTRVFSKPEELETIISVSDKDGEENLAISGMNHFIEMFDNFSVGFGDSGWNRNQATLIEEILQSSK